MYIWGISGTKVKYSLLGDDGPVNSEALPRLPLLRNVSPVCLPSPSAEHDDSLVTMPVP